MTFAALEAITRPAESRVIRVAPDTMSLGLPIASTFTAWFT